MARRRSQKEWTLFHPAVNKTLDELTGKVGEMQLQSFIDNIHLALAAKLSF